MSTSPLDQRRADELEAIETCHADPIHLIGTVQPTGWLLGVDGASPMTITHVSENIAEFTGLSAPDVLGMPLQGLLSETAVHTIRNAAGHATITFQREYIETTSLREGQGTFAISAHRTGDTIILELTPAEDESALSAILGEAQRLLATASQCTEVDELLNTMVELLRSFSGYDRVKAYRFLPDGAGEVAAESRSAHVDSFLGLRFPAFDIPQAARALYAATPIRVISDIAAAQVPILAAASADEEIDLSLAVLRGTVAGHIMYLENMGVRATMSLPIVVDGEMWGLFSFHHYEAHHPTSIESMAFELVGRSASLMVQHLLQRNRAQRIARCAELEPKMFITDDSPLGLAAYWETARSDLATVLQCDGVALVAQERVDVYGDCPPGPSVRAIVDEHIGATAPGSRAIRAEHCIHDYLPGLALGSTSGMLIMPSPLPLIDAIVFFRNTSTHGVRWAGNAQSSFEDTAQGLRLTPRGSFAEYVEDHGNRCDQWTAADLDSAEILQNAFERLHGKTEAQTKHRERLGLMVRELNHRVRNILALVRSLVSQSQGVGVTLDDYVTSLEQRITSLAGAHDLLTESEWQSVSMQRLIHQAVSPYQDDAGRIAVSGPPIVVPASLASMLALVVHELLSNAAKYGALTTPSGTVTLSWELDDRFRIFWEEAGGPEVQAEPVAGFGTSIIRNALPFEFDGTADLRYEPEGIRAQFDLPASLVEPAIDLADGELGPSPSSRLRVLVVEDDYIISRATVGLVEEAGHVVAGVEPSIRAALAALELGGIDFLLLDANIRGEFSLDVARSAAQRGIPFAFLTGYGSRDRELAGAGALGIITKPLTATKLEQYLAMAIAAPAESTP